MINPHFRNISFVVKATVIAKRQRVEGTAVHALRVAAVVQVSLLAQCLATAGALDLDAKVVRVAAGARHAAALTGLKLHQTKQLGTRVLHAVFAARSQLRVAVRAPRLPAEQVAQSSFLFGEALQCRVDAATLGRVRVRALTPQLLTAYLKTLRQLNLVAHRRRRVHHLRQLCKHRNRKVI